ncbi:MAG: VOC family protein [Pseudomonadota bacterium]
MSVIGEIQPNMPETAKKRGVVAPYKLAHVNYRTSNYEEMINWHCKVLNAKITMSTPMLTFLTYDDEHHRVAIGHFPELAEQSLQVAGCEHTAYTYETLGDLMATYERLKGEGIEPYWCVNHGGTLSYYYFDPDRNQLELQIDVFDSVEELNKWFDEGDFHTNPVGVKVDPDDMLARFKAGEDEKDLLFRPTIDPSEIPAQLPTVPRT